MAQWIEKMKAWAAANEPGTLEYTFGRDALDGDVFGVWERYANADALKV
jgi:quinol monooxygenase YgiN